MLRRDFIAGFGAAAWPLRARAQRGRAEYAADLKLLSPVVLQSTMNTVIPAFERSSGHKVTIIYGTVGAVAEGIRNGQAADAVMTTAPLIDDLAKLGKVVSESRINLAKVGIGVFVRSGASRPDISTVDAFKRALSAAKSIGYVDPPLGAPVGIYMAGLIERIGMTKELKPKTKLLQVAERFEHVAKGEVDIGFALTSEIIEEPEIELVGPLPAPIQSETLYAGAVVAYSSEQDAGKMLMRFIASPATAAVMKMKGFQSVTK